MAIISLLDPFVGLLTGTEELVIVANGTTYKIPISALAIGHGVDGEPDAFSFADVSDAELSTDQTSNVITVAGLGAGISVAVTISGGIYSKNGGAYSSSDGTAQNGDTFQVKHTSSENYDTAVNTTLTIGGVSDTFSSTTLVMAPVVIPSYATIATFGDSITVGVAAATASNRWANRIATATGAALTNAGISGTILQNGNDSGGSPRANNGRDRFVSALLGANKRSAVFIAYGFNDARYVAAPATLNATLYASDYREVLSGLIIGGYAPEDIYVLSPYYISDTGLTTGSTGFAGQTRSGFEEYVAAAEAVAAEFGARYCDLYAELNTPEWIAEVNGNDAIHPLDTGHGSIATAIQTRTFDTNTRNAPTGLLVSSPSDGEIATSWDAVAGASGYTVEYGVEGSYTFPVSETTTNLTFTWTGVASGSYRVRVRANFSGKSSRWVFAASAISATSAASDTVTDTFTDTAGTSLTAHTPEVGGAWVLSAGESSGAMSISSAGRAYSADMIGTFRNTAAMPFANQYVEADLVRLSAVSGHSAGIAARMEDAFRSHYFARYAIDQSRWDLFKAVNGTFTNLGSYDDAGFTDGTTRKCRLECDGTTITMKIDGVTRVSVTDDSLSEAAFAGTRSGGAVTDTTGIHLDNFKAGAL